MEKRKRQLQQLLEETHNKLAEHAAGTKLLENEVSEDAGCNLA